MAGQIIVNFEGLTGEAAKALAQGMVDAVKTKVDLLTQAVGKMSSEDAMKLERLLSGTRADGNCGNGCAGT